MLYPAELPVLAAAENEGGGWALLGQEPCPRSLLATPCPHRSVRRGAMCRPPKLHRATLNERQYGRGIRRAGRSQSGKTRDSDACRKVKAWSVDTWFPVDFGGSAERVLAHAREYAGPALKRKSESITGIAE